MKIWIYRSESYSWIYFYIFINKIWKIYWSEQCITGLGPEDRWSSWGLNQRSWAGGPVIIVRTESEVLGRKTGDHREDWIRGLGPEDRWSSWGLNQRSWAGRQVIIVRTESDSYPLGPHNYSSYLMIYDTHCMDVLFVLSNFSITFIFT
jgi:hypothetical protein